MPNNHTFVKVGRESFISARKVLLGSIIDTIGTIKNIRHLTERNKNRVRDISAIKREIDETMKLINKLEDVMPKVRAVKQTTVEGKKKEKKLKVVSTEKLVEAKARREERKEARVKLTSRLDFELLEIKKKLAGLG